MPINPTPTIPILTISVFPLLFDVYGFAPFSRIACFAPFFRIPGAFPGALATILSGAKPTGHLGERSCLSGLTGSATSAPSLAHPRGRSLPHLPGLVRLPDPPPAFDLQGGQPAPAVAEGVDALEIPQVENFSVLLRRVADD